MGDDRKRVPSCYPAHSDVFFLSHVMQTSGHLTVRQEVDGSVVMDFFTSTDHQEPLMRHYMQPKVALEFAEAVESVSRVRHTPPSGDGDTQEAIRRALDSIRAAWGYWSDGNEDRAENVLDHALHHVRRALSGVKLARK